MLLILYNIARATNIVLILCPQDMTFGHNVGGARSFYTFELYLEICPEGEEFRVYNKGGLNLKILVIDLPGETVREPFQMRGEHGWTVAHLKYVIAGVRYVYTYICTYMYGWTARLKDVVADVCIYTWRLTHLKDVVADVCIYTWTDPP